jgi:hypothetical protein
VLTGPTDDSPPAAIDPVSCRTLWTYTNHVFQVGTGLIQADVYKDAINSLGPPG